MPARAARYKGQILFLTEERHYTDLSLDFFGNYVFFFGSDELKNKKLEDFSIIVIDQQTSQSDIDLLRESNRIWINIGEKKVDGSFGALTEDFSQEELLDLLYKLIGKAFRPQLKHFEIGTIVRSKSTSNFGKGVVVAHYNDEVLKVRFPMSKLCASKAIKCHKSNLQIIGKVDKDTKEAYSFDE